MSFEIRDVDLREMDLKPNVIGLPPKGDTLQVVPATFEKVADTKARLEIVAAADARDTLVVIRYGDREATLRFLPRGEWRRPYFCSTVTLTILPVKALSPCL